jgi:phenylalanyl-tRNA synthetase beta chain
MRIPLSWISLYTPLDTLLTRYPIKDLAHEYSIHTAEIDGIEEHFLDKVVVGKVISCDKHPESKKLSIVEVELGEHGKTVILTWAANIVEAKYVPVAIVGAVLPGDFIIGERMMAGMMSRGMICSDDELGLTTERAEGIMILESIWEENILEKMLGKSFFDLTLPFPGKDGKIYDFPLRDTTFEIDNKFITNRPDLFSVVGNAREFGAVFDLPPWERGVGGIGVSESQSSVSSSLKATKSQLLSQGALQTKIETPHCLSYHLMKMENIVVGKSPWGISLMMERSGLAAKMDIVDITNLIMTELGQPMHAFDADKITGNISVRQAKKWEKILALNGSEYELTIDDMVIADESGPVAIAWVIGGMDSAVSESTTSIIWESGCFDATSVRLTAQRHGIRTDASTRYEKSLDPLLASTTFPRVLEYMKFLGKDIRISGTSTYLDESRVNHITIDVDYVFINMKAGMEISKERVNSILEKLGFEISPPPLIGEAGRGTPSDSPYKGENQTIRITVPSWRASKDISIREDIAEEICRIVGYENTPMTPLPIGQAILEKNHDIELRDITLAHFRGEKWNEIYTYSFTSESLDKKILMPSMESAVGVRNAFNEEYTHMRRSLAPRILMSVAENMKYSENFWFFEIGKIYTKTPHSDEENTLLRNIAIKPFPERKMIAWVAIGQTLESLRKNLESYLYTVLGYIPPVYSGAYLGLLHPGMSGSYREWDTSIIEFWVIHPEVAASFWLGEDTIYFQADFSVLLEHYKNRDPRFHPISKYQTIPRELNFVMQSNTPTGDVARTLDTLHPWIWDVYVASIYEDDMKLGAGKKSVNFAFTLSNHDDTISDEDAMKVQDMVIEEMGKKGYDLRT